MTLFGSPPFQFFKAEQGAHQQLCSPLNAPILLLTLLFDLRMRFSEFCVLMAWLLRFFCHICRVSASSSPPWRT